MLLGIQTDTQDISGTVLEQKETSDLTEEMVLECIKSYIGEYDQMPPMYSALKVNGKKLYELAREGKVVERKTRKVMIHSIEVQEIELPRVRMTVKCSKGTYIRTLCHDIGNSLGTGACMEKLLRTKVSRFELKNSLRLSEIEEFKANGRLMEIILPVDEIFTDYPALTVNSEQARLAYNGNPLKQEEFTQIYDGYVRVYDEAHRFIGIYRADHKKKLYRLEKMFLDEEELRG